MSNTSNTADTCPLCEGRGYQLNGKCPVPCECPLGRVFARSSIAEKHDDEYDGDNGGDNYDDDCGDDND